MEPRLTAIEENEVLLYLGYKGGEIPADVMDEIHRCMDVMMQAARPRAVWRRFDLCPDGTLKGTDFVPQGKDIRALLQESRQVILLGATLGTEVEALLRRRAHRNHPCRPSIRLWLQGSLLEPHAQGQHSGGIPSAPSAAV